MIERLRLVCNYLLGLDTDSKVTLTRWVIRTSDGETFPYQDDLKAQLSEMQA